MDEGLVSQLAQFAWEAFQATKPQGVSSAADLTAAAESTLRLFGDDPIDASLDGLGHKEIAALRICIELDSANAAQKNQAVVTLAQAFEPFIKRLLARVDAAAFDRYRRSSRSFDLKRSLAHLGLGLAGNFGPEQIDRHDSPQREIDWAYVARNECAHGAPKWSHVDRNRRCAALVAAMLLAAHQHNRSLTTAHAAVDWSDLTHRILDQSAIDEVRSRFVTLIAGEQALSPIEPTASEMAWVDPFEMGSAAIADEEDTDADDDSSDGLGRDGPLFKQRRGKVAQLILDIGRFLLVGRPGAGKTTSLRMVEWQLAKDLAEGSQPLAPVLVELKRCRPSIGAGVLSLAAKRMGVEHADQILADGEIVLLLDGVNEIAESEFDAVQVEIEEILCDYPTLPVLITSRPGWHRNQVGLPVFALDPLDDAQIEEFLEKNMRPDIVPKFLAELRSFPKLWAIARNPLTLTMLARVGEGNGGIVPENRAIVIKCFFESLVQREASKASQIDPGVKRILLSRLAWEMRTHGVMLLPTERALRILAATRSDLALGITSEAFLDEVTDNGFLQHIDDEVSFEHEVFLDFFAAVELSQQVDKSPTIATELSEQPRWRETVLLAYGLGEPKSTVRDQVKAGRPSVAAEALLEQKDTTIEQRAELARSISTRIDNESPATDVLLSLITLGDGDALFHWFLGDRRRSSAVGRLDPNSVDAVTAIRAMLSLMQAECREYPGRADQIVDNQGSRFKDQQCPSHAFLAFVRRHPGIVPAEVRQSLEKHVLEVCASRLPKRLRWKVLVDLSAFLPSFLVREDLTGERGHSLSKLCQRALLKGQLWRALPAYVELAKRGPSNSQVDQFGPPITAGRDWIRVIKDGVVAETQTKDLLDWIERLLETRVCDASLNRAFCETPRRTAFLYSNAPPHVFLRCFTVLTALVPSESQLDEFGIPRILWTKSRDAGVAPRTLMTFVAKHIAEHCASLSAGTEAGFAIHAKAVSLHRFLKKNVVEVVYAASGAASTHSTADAEVLRAPQVPVPGTEEEAAIFDRIHAGRRFSFTVISSRAETRYRFLRFDDAGGLTAFYWPPDDANHDTLQGGERVTAEIRSTWVKKKNRWGIRALDLQVQDGPHVIAATPLPDACDAGAHRRDGTNPGVSGNPTLNADGMKSGKKKIRLPNAKATRSTTPRSAKRASCAKTIGRGIRIISAAVLLALAILIGVAAYVAIHAARVPGLGPG